MSLTIPLNPYLKSELIHGIRCLTDPIKYPNNGGDVWDSTWADDGHIYRMSDDTTGIDGIDGVIVRGTMRFPGKIMDCMDEMDVAGKFDT